MSNTNSDDNPEIIWADDACPVCHNRIDEPGEFMGIWDGSLGDGCGNWYSKVCDTCGSQLIGWEYGTIDDPMSRIRWETNAKGR
jgi:hypothetical protein